MPRVSIGLPVYNGEDYLEEALLSLLGQTFTDFELIVSDNASNDGTAEICRRFAAADPRVRYHRFPENRGAAVNFNHVFALAGGEYFRWAAHDDVCAPEYLARCVEVLDRDPSIVLCHSRSGRLDETSRVDGVYDFPMRLDSPRVEERWRDLIVVRHPCIAVFGLMRPQVLRRTPLIGAYVSSDRVLLAELALHGRLHEIPEVLFYRRHHRAVSSALDERRERLAWFDPKLQGRISLPNWRVLHEYHRALLRAPLTPRQRLACARQLGAHCAARGGHLRHDLAEAAKMAVARAPGGRRLLAGLKRTLRRQPPVF